MAGVSNDAMTMSRRAPYRIQVQIQGLGSLVPKSTKPGRVIESNSQSADFLTDLCKTSPLGCQLALANTTSLHSI